MSTGIDKSTIIVVFENWTEQMLRNATFVTEFGYYKRGTWNTKIWIQKKKKKAKTNQNKKQSLPLGPKVSLICLLYK